MTEPRRTHGTPPTAGPGLAAPATIIRPRLAPKARLRFDRKSGRHMLLYPEKGLVLNSTAVDILRLCTGELSVEAIVERLAAKYAPQPRDVVEREVLAFLATMADRGLVREGP
ncbi:MAG: pyrroloquinoline quinone biosynthesis peptide chaperone PqqD [Candidatus Rokubacteria bacterium]|nr:pyrroloquinoline quinone biosynthesis peptide chaperone PqqD [Candidatus Rokubacteria bacterium]